MLAEALLTGVRLQEDIPGPAQVNQSGNRLVWTLARSGISRQCLTLKEYNMGCQDMPLKEYNCQGCLSALRRLKKADLASEAVLAFARRWGVLAIYPCVQEEKAPEGRWWEDQRAVEPTYYSEPVAVYTRLARVLDFLVRANKSLRAGGSHLPVWKTDCAADTVSEADYLEIALRRWNEQRAKGEPSEKLYAHLNLMVSYLTPRSFSLGLSSRSVSETSYLGVCYGLWSDGFEWDRKRADWCRYWETISPKPCPSMILGSFDAGYARPSALYNALVWELMKEMMPREGASFCSVCGKEYMTGRNTEEGGKERRGKRWDKKGNTCLGSECQAQLKRTRDHERRAKERKEKFHASFPPVL